MYNVSHDNLFSPKYIKDLLSQYGFSPSTAYGQHYLTSSAVIDDMLAAAGELSGQTVVEVGPGFGVLTFALAKRVKQVVSFEIEQQLSLYWEKQQENLPNVKIVWGNALQTFPLWLKENGQTPYSVVANIPYQITGEIFRLFMEASPAPRVVVLLVQKEVADRMCARSGGMSLLSLAAQYYAEPRIVRSVPAGAFFPPPKVASAVVALCVKSERESPEKEALFWRIAHAAFHSKRKQIAVTLRNALGVDPEQTRKALTSLHYSEKARPEELSVVDWQKLRDYLRVLL